MKKRVLTEQISNEFRDYLYREEKSAATIEKYTRDVRAFFDWIKTQEVTKESVIAYKQQLLEAGYAIRSINSMIASLNSLLEFLGWIDCKVKTMRIQRQTYCAEEKELTKPEYMRLLESSRHDVRLQLLLKTICSTGIRVSELKYFTVEAVKNDRIIVQSKSKSRIIFLPNKLKKQLLNYAKMKNIIKGSIFVTRSGRPLDRSNIWHQMKQLCQVAHVNPTKVFPHNLRKLFARTFYGIEKDIAKLADILGHSNIETTRIYIMSTGYEHRQKIQRLGLAG